MVLLYCGYQLKRFVREAYFELEKAFDNTGFRPEKRLANAKALGETSLLFLVHPTLTQAEIDKTVAVMRQVIALASK